MDWPRTAQDMGQTVGRGVVRRRGLWSEGYSGRIWAYVGSLESPYTGLSGRIRGTKNGQELKEIWGEEVDYR